MPTSSSKPSRLRVSANGLEHEVLEWLPDPAAPRIAAKDRAARTVVLVHGFMDASGTWDLVAPALVAAGFRVLAPDMRGFGEGPRVPAGAYYHFVDYVFDLADMVDRLCPGEPIALVGHSMGGTITTLYAGTFPERVTRLALIEGVGPPDHPWEAGPLRMRAWIDQVRAMRARGERLATLTREEALQRLSANHGGIAPEVLARKLPYLVRDAGEGRVTWSFDALHRTTAPVPFFAKLFVEFAKKVTCPVLFVSGGPQGFHPPDEDARLAAFADRERAEVSGAGHMVHWTEPAALAQLLIGHFASRA